MKITRWSILLILLLAASPALANCDAEPRIGARMIYDPVDQRILMYGGADWQNEYRSARAQVPTSRHR